jgi:hypothetical protein
MLTEPRQSQCAVLASASVREGGREGGREIPGAGGCPWRLVRLVHRNRALSDRCVATLADLPSTTASHPDFHDLCSQVRQRAVRLAAVVARRGERHDRSHSGHSRLRRLLLPHQVPRIAAGRIRAAMAATTRGGPSRVLDERPPWWLSSERTSGRFYGRSC